MGLSSSSSNVVENDSNTEQVQFLRCKLNLPEECINTLIQSEEVIRFLTRYQQLEESSKLVETQSQFLQRPEISVLWTTVAEQQATIAKLQTENLNLREKK